jgi:hypothetical protein
MMPADAAGVDFVWSVSLCRLTEPGKIRRLRQEEKFRQEDIFMGILDDIKRLGIELNDDDIHEIEAMHDRAKAQKKEKIVQDTLVEYYIGEYLTIVRPEIMSALEADKTAQNKELINELQRQFDDKGNRICDEVGCLSAEGLGKCEYCGRYVCANHNYGKAGHSCYACYLEKGGKPRES